MTTDGIQDSLEDFINEDSGIPERPQPGSIEEEVELFSRPDVFENVVMGYPFWRHPLLGGGSWVPQGPLELLSIRRDPENNRKLIGLVHPTDDIYSVTEDGQPTNVNDFEIHAEWHDPPIPDVFEPEKLITVRVTAVEL